MRIHVLGDSIVTAYGSDENNFIGGWGDHLNSFFKNEVPVFVYAEGGRSSRSFLNEGRFINYGIFSKDKFPYGMGPAYDRICAGDYVLMQFCHNDDESKGYGTYVDRLTPLGKPDSHGIYPTVVPDEQMKVSTGEIPPEYVTLLRKNGMAEQEIAVYERKYRELIAQYGEKYWSYDCGATYKGYLKFYIDKIRARGAVPVLVTPPPRQYYKNGKIAAVAGQHGGEDAFGAFPYVRAIRQLGRQENVVVLDLFQRSLELLERLGETAAKSLESIKDKDGVTIGEARYGRTQKWVEDYDVYWKKGNFTVDNTYQNRLGSYLYAAMIADCISEQLPNLAQWQLPCASKSMRCPARIRTFIPVMEAAVHHIGIKIV